MEINEESNGKTEENLGESEESQRKNEESYENWREKIGKLEKSDEENEESYVIDF